MADTIVKILGSVTAYADAVSAGYPDTREQFAIDLANCAKNAAQVREYRDTAVGAADSAEEAKDIVITIKDELRDYARFGSFILRGNRLIAVMNAASEISDISINQKGHMVITIGD